MPMDLYRSGDHFVLHCDLAGVDPGSVQVDVDGRVLTVRAERSARTDADVQWLRRERAQAVLWLATRVSGAFTPESTRNTSLALMAISARTVTTTPPRTIKG